MEYQINLIRVVDGDTVIADIDLGFDIILRSQTIRLNNIDSPEIHSNDEAEKKQGLISKQKLINLLMRVDIKTNQFIPKPNIILFTEKNYRDKYGRILGGLKCGNIIINDYLVKNNYAVKYEGENKADIKKLHLQNRQILINRKELFL